MRNLPPPDSSVALRTLINLKQKRGQFAEALVLARLGVRIAKHERISSDRDAISRMAMGRYLELMPEDEEVHQMLEGLVKESAQGTSRSRRLWALLIVCGISTVGAVYSYAIPDHQPDPVQPALARVRVESPPSPVAPATVIAKQDETGSPIVIRAVGDVVLGSNFPRYRLPGSRDKERITALRRELMDADIVMGNLEGVLSDRGTSRKDPAKSGLFTFRMPVNYAVTLREMGFDVLCLANNHTMDFGAEGMESTKRALIAEEIQPVGVPGAEVAIVRVKNTTVAFLNYSYLPAVTRLDDEEQIIAQIKHARLFADLVVVSVHGGKEGVSAIGAPTGDEYYLNEYRGDILKFSHLAIDAGASAVFGHGPHVVRPYEVYKDKPIFYSLGNFVGYRSLSTRGKLANSIIAEVRFSHAGRLLGAGVIPLKLDRSGIPCVDYSPTSLDTLDGLLDEQLEKRPVLELSLKPAVRVTASAHPPAVSKSLPPSVR